MKTLSEFIAELREFLTEYDDIPVENSDGDDATAEYIQDDPDDPVVVVG